MLKKKKKISFKFKMNKKNLLIGGAIIIFISIILFIPPLYSKSYAESRHNNADKSKTQYQDIGILDWILGPRYIVITKPDEKDQVDVHEMVLDRRFVFLWEIKRDSLLVTTDKKDIDEKFLAMVAHDNERSEKLAEEERGKKSPTNNNNTTSEDLYSFIESENEQSANSLLKEITDPNSKYDVKVYIGNPLEEVYTTIDGKVIPELKNTWEIHFDLEGKYLYYSKYKILQSDDIAEQNDTISDGKIYRYSPSAKKEEKIYDFKTQKYVSFRANQEKIAYATVDGELGVINIETKIKTKIDDSKIPNPNKGGSTEVEFISYSIVDIGQETALIEVNSDSDLKNTFFRLNLETLKMSEL